VARQAAVPLPVAQFSLCVFTAELHAVVPTAAAVNAMSAARPSRADGQARSGTPATSLVTTTPQNGHVASFRRMCRLHSAQLTRVVMVQLPRVASMIYLLDLIGGAP
jgi:hypothetical protein